MPKDKYQIRLLRIAEEDLNEIISFIAADNPTAALSTADKIEKNINLLSENPKLGRSRGMKISKVLVTDT